MRIRRPDIMNLLMFSSPFCRPLLQIRKPKTTVSAIQKAISPGEASRFEKTSPQAAASVPAGNWPTANL